MVSSTATVLITGITGRVGANVALALLEKGYRVRGLVRPGSPSLGRLDRLDAERCEGDLRDLDAVTRAVAGVDAIVHCAAVIGKPATMSDRDYFASNVTGTWNVVHAASRVAPNLQRLVYTSTDATYSSDVAQYLPIDERHPQLPYSPYGLTKLLGEQIVLHYHRQMGLPTAVTRIGFVMLGAQILDLFTARQAMRNLTWYQHPRSKVYVEGIAEPWKAIEAAVADPSALVIPRNQQGESWLHHPTDMHDTVQGIVRALENPAVVGEAFNIFAAQPTTWEEASRYIHERTGRDVVEVTLPNHWAWSCDVAKARRLLGYEPRYDYRRMIDAALAFEKGEDVGVIA